MKMIKYHETSILVLYIIRRAKSRLSLSLSCSNASLLSWIVRSEAPDTIELRAAFTLDLSFWSIDS